MTNIAPFQRTQVVKVNDSILGLVQFDRMWVTVEVPWRIGSDYAMADIMRRASTLLARIEAKPTRVRLEEKRPGLFSLIIID